MIKRLFILLSVIITTSSLYGQNQKTLKTVQVPDSTKSILMTCLIKQEKLPTAEERGMYIFNLQKPNDLLYKDGIFTFRLIGPHYYRRIFIVNGTELIIFNSQYVDDLLQEFSSFIKHSTLTTKKKIEYLKAVSIFLEEEYKAENS